MKVLIVCSGNKGRVNPFISEQVDSLKKLDVSADYFIIQGKGVGGYLANLFRLLRMVRKYRYDIVHAHYGLSGLLAVFQRKVPVVITFHGSDVKKKSVLRFSKVAARLSAFNIVVESSFVHLLGVKRSNIAIIPCGVDLTVFFRLDRLAVRSMLGYDSTEKLVLFSSSFANPVKNYELARQAIEETISKPLLIELKDYSRAQVCQLMNAADILLMTSFSEGSPQVVKEALACGLPVISTKVGDLGQLVTRFESIHLVPYDSKVIAMTIDRLLEQPKRVKPNPAIESYNIEAIAGKVRAIYSTIRKEN